MKREKEFDILACILFVLIFGPIALVMSWWYRARVSWIGTMKITRQRK